MCCSVISCSEICYPVLNCSVLCCFIFEAVTHSASDWSVLFYLVLFFRVLCYSLRLLLCLILCCNLFRDFFVSFFGFNRQRSAWLVSELYCLEMSCRVRMSNVLFDFKAEFMHSINNASYVVFCHVVSGYVQMFSEVCWSAVYC